MLMENALERSKMIGTTLVDGTLIASAERVDPMKLEIFPRIRVHFGYA